MTRSFRASVGPVAAVACAALVVPTAQASYPGQNGVIAFAANGPPFHPERPTAGARTIRVADPRSGRMRQITHVPRRCGSRGWTWEDSEASFAASGRRIVYLHSDDCDPTVSNGIYIMRPDGSERTLIREGPTHFLEDPALSPSGELVAFSDFDQGSTLIREVRPPRRERSLGSCPSDQPLCDLAIFRYDDQQQPAWGSTGRMAVSLADIAGRGAGHIGTVRADGTRLRLVTRSVRDAAADWSPTADRIAFERQKDPTSRTVLSDVLVAQARGGAQRSPQRLTHTRDSFSPVWSPDGRSIAYLRAPRSIVYEPKRVVQRAVGSLWIMRASDGRRQRLLASRIVADRISWQPRSR
jgi:Tol biopolymer transport system component